MKKCNDRVIKVVLSAVATAFHWAFGGWSMALIALIALIVVDFFTGLAVAKKNGEIDSNKRKAGGIRKEPLFCTYLYHADDGQGFGAAFPGLTDIGYMELDTG